MKYGIKVICKIPPNRINFPKNAIGYAGKGYRKKTTRTQPINGITYFFPSKWNIKQKTYKPSWACLCTDWGFHYFKNLRTLFTYGKYSGYDPSKVNDYDFWIIEIDDSYPFYDGKEKSICKKFRFIKKIPEDMLIKINSHAETSNILKQIIKLDIPGKAK